MSESTENDTSGSATTASNCIIQENIRISVFQGHQLTTYKWLPQQENIKALLCVCHGVHEYMGTYQRLADHLMDHGVLVFGMDMVGHGRSEGVRGHVDSIDSYATDVISFIEDTKKEYPSLPTFLLGHSMGGMVALMVAIRSQTNNLLSGLLVSAPAIVIEGVTTFKKHLLRVLSYITPKMNVFNFDESQICSIPEETEAYLNDPLVIRLPNKAGWCSAMLRAVEVYRERLGEINIPLIALHGTRDLVIPQYASEMVYDRVASTDKKLELFVDSYHKILNDIEQERVKQVIATWITERL